ALDLVSLRQKLVFETHAGRPAEGIVPKGRVGFNRSFLVNTYYPLYSTFFATLGYEPVIADACLPAGVDEKEASFCYPAELAHGFFHNLLSGEHRLDYIFLPHFKALPNTGPANDSQVCPFVQGETFYLRTTFRPTLESLENKDLLLLTPLIDLSCGIEAMEKPLLAAAQKMGAKKSEARQAFKTALLRQQACFAQMRQAGENALRQLEENPLEMAVILVGRPYAGLAAQANKGIPRMFASRGHLVIPLDFLPIANEPGKRHMYWGTGQQILQAAGLIQKHPQLFGAYITNFSCGPDSFLLTYFRDIMASKPSLTLELDSHTACAGLETRIEAFLDVISAYRQLHSRNIPTSANESFMPAQITFERDTATVIASGGEILPLTDPRVTVLIPAMGELAAKMLASVFAGRGFHPFVHPAADESVLKIGRAHTSCKECLPLILTTGTLINYIRHLKKPGEIVAYFMPTGAGPCRFGQYSIFMEDLITRLRIPDVAILSTTSENAYAGLDSAFRLRAWWGAVISDVLEDIRSLLLVRADDPCRAMRAFDEESTQLVDTLKDANFKTLLICIKDSLERLKAIPGLQHPRRDVPVIALVGEIFVRRDELSRQRLTEKLAEKGFAVICSPVGEWILYTQYLVKHNILRHNLSALDRLKFLLVEKYVARHTRKIHDVMHRSGLVLSKPVTIDEIIRHADPFISPHLTGEAILTIGSAIHEIASSACGVISISPFGCMPGRLAESVLNRTLHSQTKLTDGQSHPGLLSILKDEEALPFLAIESDGSPYPQIIQAKLEAFCLRAKRLHDKMQSALK
ncbi:MAG: acyl-CoA dehydratase activase-related protein, partial [Smithellaceae bacterium]